MEGRQKKYKRGKNVRGRHKKCKRETKRIKEGGRKSMKERKKCERETE